MVITVVCPSCATSFPVDPAKIPVGGVQARCTSCGEIFRVERPEEAVPGSPAAPAAPVGSTEAGPVEPRDEEASGAVGSGEDASGEEGAGEEEPGAGASEGASVEEEAPAAEPSGEEPSWGEPVDTPGSENGEAGTEETPGHERPTFDGPGEGELEEDPYAASLPGAPPASQAATESLVAPEEPEVEEAMGASEAPEDPSEGAEESPDAAEEASEEEATHGREDPAMDEWTAWAYEDPAAVVEDAVEDVESEGMDAVEEAGEDPGGSGDFEIDASTPLEGAGAGDEGWGTTLSDAGIETDSASREEDPESSTGWAAGADDAPEDALEEAEAMDWVFETEDEVGSSGSAFGSGGPDADDDSDAEDDWNRVGESWGMAGSAIVPEEGATDDADPWMAEPPEETVSGEPATEGSGEEADEEESLAGDGWAWAEPADEDEERWTAEPEPETDEGAGAAVEGEWELAEAEEEEREDEAVEDRLEPMTRESSGDGIEGEAEAAGMVVEPPRAFAEETLAEAPLEAEGGEEPAPVEEPVVKGFSFGQRDPDDKARRLARVLVSDMIMYNPERHQRALKNGTLEEDFQEEIAKSWKEYVDQVGAEMAEGTRYWTSALNDILAKGERVF